MTTLAPEQVAAQWTPMAAGYDETARLLTQIYAWDALRLVAPAEGDRVLDIAAGTGALTLAAAETGAHVLATDFSPGMTAFLEQRVEELELSNVDVAVMNGQDLEVEDDTFDSAFSTFGLMLFPDRAAGFREMCRALKPGGNGAVAVWGPPEELGFFQWMMKGMQRAFPNAPPPERVPSWLALTNRDTLRAEMKAGGFGQVNVYTVAHLWTFPSPEWMWERLEGMAPGVRFIFERLDDAGREAFGRALIDSVREKQGDGPYALESLAHIAVGTKD